MFLLMQREIKWVDYWLEVEGFIFFLISSPLNEDQEIFYILRIWIKMTIVWNIYGVYSNRVSYWEKKFKLDYIRQQNVLVGFEPNFSIGSAKIWNPLI